MAFINARLLEGVSYGTSYGTGYKTRINELKSGQERRGQLWSIPRGSFSVLYQTLLPEDHEKVISAFHVAAGRAHTFRFQDLTDYKADMEVVGFGTGETQTYQLGRTYSFGGVSTFVERKLIVAGSVEVFVNGAPYSAVVDYMAGTITLNAPDGVEVAWSGEFDKLVRFDDDDLIFTIDTRAGGRIPVLSTDVAVKEVLS